MRLTAVGAYTRGKKAVQTKTATNARSRPTLCTVARLSLEIEGNRTAGRAHQRPAMIDQVDRVAKRKMEDFNTCSQRRFALGPSYERLVYNKFIETHSARWMIV